MAAPFFICRAYVGQDSQFLDVVTGTNITGFTIVATIKAYKTDLLPFLTLTGTIVSGPGGQVSFPLSRAQSLLMNVGTWRMDVWRTDSGAQSCLSDGVLIMSQGVRGTPETFLAANDYFSFSDAIFTTTDH